jgi:hypothetical protein
MLGWSASYHYSWSFLPGICHLCSACEMEDMCSPSHCVASHGHPTFPSSLQELGEVWPAITQHLCELSHLNCFMQVDVAVLQVTPRAEPVPGLSAHCLRLHVLRLAL